MDMTRNPETFTGTVSETLDRLEVPANKIGLINSNQAMALLHGLDAAYERIQEMNPGSQSRKVAETQFEGILAKLRSETAQFLRDLGGAHVLRHEREMRNLPQDYEWWYLDLSLADKRRVSFKKYLTTGGIVLVVFIVLVVVYNNFLAPDPIVSAIYGHEHSARDLMINGDLAAAKAEVDQALELNPQEPTILILKGVIQEGLGETDAAAQTYAQSQQLVPSRELFLITRGQAYLYMNWFEEALLDGQEVVRVNPDSAQGHLLTGQAHELLKNFGEAQDSYDKAFEAAEKTGQTELAAISRTRLAMLMQMMNSQLDSPEFPTETP